MPREVEVVIIHSENQDGNRLPYRNMSQLKKVYVEVVKQIVEGEVKNDEDAE